MDCTSFILATLLNSSGIFESVTKLQKLAFLSIYEHGLERFTSFKWHYYGPFSTDIQNTINDLEEKGILSEKELNRVSCSGNEYTIKQFTLTMKGRRLAERWNTKISKENRIALVETIEEYGSRPLAEILDYVYKAYSPEDL
jgi:uncharacterized protein YwgA